ncbi:MAG TPA: aldo/keto reductase [Gammaproteobacteria bacterium]|nr:aldo/keto reductase [Gammaproteobacteria bacterium]HIN89829.1 aldo/keto reductase [Porticoccaceae bacterium]
MSLAKRQLGQSCIDVSVLGLGTVKFGRNQGVKYPTTFSLPSDRELIAMLDQARSLGINLLDTAPAYGSSEQRLGRLLTDRQDWVICTKVGEEFLNGKSFYDFTEAHVRYSIERSLQNLNTDYLDIVLVHSDGNDMHIIESTACLPTLMKLKEKGLIRAVGMSTKSLHGGLKAVELSDLVMVTYNPSTTDDAEVIRYANSLNKGVLIKKALNSGHVATVGENSIDNKLKFALTPAGVSSVIVGTISPEHLRENVESVVKAFA